MKPNLETKPNSLIHFITIPGRLISSGGTIQRPKRIQIAPSVNFKPEERRKFLKVVGFRIPIEVEKGPIRLLWHDTWVKPWNKIWQLREKAEFEHAIQQELELSFNSNSIIKLNSFKMMRWFCWIERQYKFLFSKVWYIN